VDRTSPTPPPCREKDASDLMGQQEIHPQQGDSFMTTKKKATKKNATKKKATGNKAAKKKASGRKYGPAAGKQVEIEMREFKAGKLKSGRSGKTVTNPKQAIAIGLSEARKKGAKVPPPKS
jgi:beta-glucanase (GH16 family)